MPVEKSCCKSNDLSWQFVEIFLNVDDHQCVIVKTKIFGAIAIFFFKMPIFTLHNGDFKAQK